MFCKHALRKCLQASFIAGFMLSVYKSLDRLLSMDTTISLEYQGSPVPLPALTLCPNQILPSVAVNANHNRTFQELSNSDYPLSSDRILSANFVEIKSLRGSISSTVNTTNLVHTEKWTILDQNLLRCITFKPPKIALETESGVVIQFAFSS